MDGEEQHLLKQIDFKYTDGEQGSLFIVTNVGDYVPEIKTMISEMMLVGVLDYLFYRRNIDYVGIQGAAAAAE